MADTFTVDVLGPVGTRAYSGITDVQVSERGDLKLLGDGPSCVAAFAVGHWWSCERVPEEPAEDEAE